MRQFIRPFIAVLAVAMTLAYFAGDADARVGGGSSFGSRGGRTYSAPAPTRTAPSSAPIERTMTQPTRPGTVGAPAAPGGFFNRPGMFGGLFGGLAAGFLGAGLFGMLFGHGMFGGLGGITSFLGLILQIGLVVLIARFLWGMWQRRNQPAFAGASMFGGPAPGGSGLGAAPGGSGTAAGTTIPIEISSADFDAFEQLLGEIQTAYSNDDLAVLRARATPEMLSYFAEQLAENASRGVVNQISAVKLLQGDLSEGWREGDVEYATVAMRFSLIDRTVDRASGRLVDGSDTPQEITELWTFMRVRGGNWLLSAIQQS